MVGKTNIIRKLNTQLITILPAFVRSNLWKGIPRIFYRVGGGGGGGGGGNFITCGIFEYLPIVYLGHLHNNAGVK